jgi:hypothetical protein
MASWLMPKRSSSDFAQNALRVFEQTIGEELAKPAPKKKNPAAVALGKLGGLKGGRARAEKLTPNQRKAIARKAANTRWSKTESD